MDDDGIISEKEMKQLFENVSILWLKYVVGYLFMLQSPNFANEPPFPEKRGFGERLRAKIYR